MPITRKNIQRHFGINPWTLDELPKDILNQYREVFENHQKINNDSKNDEKGKE